MNFNQGKIGKVQTVAFATIGCRANQADTARMISILPHGFREVKIDSDDCDIIIINTCAVTSRAEADARKIIRRARRRSPSSTIVVTGCAAQTGSDKYASMPEVDHVIGIAQRDRIDEILGSISDTPRILHEKPSGGVLGPTPLDGHRSRPFLKIQDGCSRGCAYCIVPKARGPERSRPMELILDDIAALSDTGYREIVLTGVHLGRWGIDLDLQFDDLLEALDKIDPDTRIRLSSIEPMDLTPDLIRRIIEHPRICPHLHIPLQSGDQDILDSMGRGHTLQEYESLLLAAIEADPDVGIGTDVMVGFPGEDISSHQNTINYIKSLPISFLHIFKYSPRSGTSAFGMKNRPDGRDVHQRMKEMKSLDAAKRAAFRKSQNGRTRMCLVESPPWPPGYITALSDNYLRIRIQKGPDAPRAGQVVPVTIDINNNVDGETDNLA